jgi:hypothetical protein
MRTESEFLVDVLGRLNQAGVPYMLTGSMASNFWGIPRTTHDLDFVLLMKQDQVDQLIAAFESGFFIQPESVRAAFQPPHQFNILAGPSRPRYLTESAGGRQHRAVQAIHDAGPPLPISSRTN